MKRQEAQRGRTSARARTITCLPTEVIYQGRSSCKASLAPDTGRRLWFQRVQRGFQKIFDGLDQFGAFGFVSFICHAPIMSQGRINRNQWLTGRRTGLVIFWRRSFSGCAGRPFSKRRLPANLGRPEDCAEPFSTGASCGTLGTHHKQRKTTKSEHSTTI